MPGWSRLVTAPVIIAALCGCGSLIQPPRPTLTPTAVASSTRPIPTPRVEASLTATATSTSTPPPGSTMPSVGLMNGGKGLMGYIWYDDGKVLVYTTDNGQLCRIIDRGSPILIDEPLQGEVKVSDDGAMV